MSIESEDQSACPASARNCLSCCIELICGLIPGDFRAGMFTRPAKKRWPARYFKLAIYLTNDSLQQLTNNLTTLTIPTKISFL